MRTNPNRLSCALALALCVGVTATTFDTPVEAQPSKAAAADTKKEAKAAYGEGNKRFKANDFAGALPFFQKADSLYPGAAPKHKVAVCLDKIGKYEEAVAAYRAFVGSNPSEKYADRVKSANERVAELEKTVPGTVTLKVSPEGLANVVYTIDGKPVAGPQLKLPAGQHAITITADGHEPTTEMVTVKGASNTDVSVMMKAVAQVVPPPPPPPPPVPEEPVDEGGDANIPAYVTLGIAGAGVVVGTIFGIQALGSQSDFDAEPTVENADDAERSALIADMSFGVALTFGITGAVLLFTGGDDEGDAVEEASLTPKVLPYAGTEGGGAVVTWQF